MSIYVYVGSRTTRERCARGEGISVFRHEPTNGALHLIQVLGDLVNPSFLALNRSSTRLYCVHGDGEEISAFSIESGTGRIALLNRQSTGGRNPVHLALDPTEQFVVVANHLSSNLAVLPIDDDGLLKPLHQQVSISGEPGPHRKEQPFAKPHYNLFDPAGHFVVVPDKGVDRLFSFRFEDGYLSQIPDRQVEAREGAGPRHLAFHPSRPWAYVVNELDSSVAAYAFDEKTGEFTPFQVLASLSDRFTGDSRASHIQVHPQGHALYASNRGEDSIAVFGIDPEHGGLTLMQTVSSQGRTPRFFTLTPDAGWLYVLNEDSDGIVAIQVDQSSGKLRPTEQQWASGSPVCMVFGVS